MLFFPISQSVSFKNLFFDLIFITSYTNGKVFDFTFPGQSPQAATVINDMAAIFW